LAEQAIATLSSGDFQARWDAAKQLHRLGVGALDAVLAALQDVEDPETAWFLASVLGRMGEPQALMALVNLMETAATADVQEMAATALVDLAIHTPALRSPVIQALQAVITHGTTEGITDEMIARRCIAVQALARLPHRDALEPLLQALQVGEPTVQAGALVAIAQFPDPQVATAIAHYLQYLDSPAHDSPNLNSPNLNSQTSTTLASLPATACPLIQAAIQAAGDYGPHWYTPTHTPTIEGEAALRSLHLGLERAVHRMLDAADPGYVDPRLGAITQALRRWPGPEADTLLWGVVNQAIAADPTTRSTPVARILAAVVPTMALRLEPQTLPQLTTILPLLLPMAAVETIQTLAATCRLLPADDPRRQAVHHILVTGLWAETPTLRSLRVRTALAIALGDLQVAESFDPLAAWLGWDDARLRFHALATLRQLDPQQGRERAIALVAPWPTAQRAIALATLAEWPT
jgi:HEAT repeat protein